MSSDQSLAKSDPKMIGQLLGSFRIDAPLGSGAMGVVYRATHTKTGTAAAVKVITAEHAARGNAAGRFEREAEILKTLRHPHIVRWLGVGRYRGTDYFAMELIQGRTLEEILEDRLRRQHEPLSWREVVELGIQICEALHYAHERNIVHRDLKPSNIMVTSDGLVKLTDFGIAKLLDADATKLTATGRTLGTAAYMAPEQIRGTPEISHKTDLYALGCLLYQMLTGQTPFQGTQLAVLMNCHLTQDPPRPSAKSADLPRDLDRLVVELMAKEPRDRPLDAEAVAERLRAIREKAERGEPIRMVFGGEMVTQETGALGGLVAPPSASLEFTGAGGTGSDPTATATPGKARRSGKRKKKGKGPAWVVPSLGTLGLIAALVALLVVVYLGLRPPSAEQLYAKARPLIESEQPADWKDAKRRYIDELERRYPDHPYKAEVGQLLDNIALNDTRAQARRIERGIAEPQTDPERLYRNAERVASEAEKAGHEDVAHATWIELAGTYRADFPKERGWLLVAEERARKLEQTITRRREEVGNLVAAIKNHQAYGRDELAAKLGARLLQDFGRYPYLEPLYAGLDLTPPPPPDDRPAPPPSDEAHPAPGDDTPSPTAPGEGADTAAEPASGSEPTAGTP